MKQIIRFNVFETNSSSTHAVSIQPRHITIQGKENIEKFKDNKLYIKFKPFDTWNNGHVATMEDIKDIKDVSDLFDDEKDKLFKDGYTNKDTIYEQFHTIDEIEAGDVLVISLTLDIRLDPYDYEISDVYYNDYYEWNMAINNVKRG